MHHSSLCFILIPCIAFSSACDDSKKKADADPSASKAEPAKTAESEPRAKEPDSPPEAKEDPASDVDPKIVEASKKFRKGQFAPEGLSELELQAYAYAQGDPEAGSFTLEQAFEGDETLADKSKGKLEATIKTTMGDIECTLFEDEAPKTVANFVGLARGVRPFQDESSKDKSWIEEKFYDSVVFHRVIEGFMIQTGDRSGSGRGGPGYVIADEIDPSRKHDRPGTLSMANRGPNTGSSQFFVTVAPTPPLDGKHAVFGKCDPKTAVKISKVKVDPRSNHRPYEPVKIETIEFSRS